MSKLAVLPLCPFPTVRENGDDDDDDDDDDGAATTTSSLLIDHGKRPDTTTDLTLENLLTYRAHVRKVRMTARQTKKDCPTPSQNDTHKDVVAAQQFEQWEWFCIHWNLANLWAQKALEENKTRMHSSKWEGESSANAFDQAACAVHVCCEMVTGKYDSDSHKIGTPGRLSFESIKNMTTPDFFQDSPEYITIDFLELWKAFLVAQTQRAVIAQRHLRYFHPEEETKKHASGQVARVCTGAAHMMERVVAHYDTRIVGTTVQAWKQTTNKLVKDWEESARGWALLLRAFADYHQALGDRDGRSAIPRWERALQYLDTLENLSKSQAPSLVGLVKQGKPMLERAIRRAMQQFPRSRRDSRNASKALEDISPLYFCPVSSWLGQYFSEWKEPWKGSAVTVASGRSLKRFKSSRPESIGNQNTLSVPPKTEKANKNASAPQPSADLEHSMEKFRKFLNDARSQSKHLLTIIYSQRDSDNAVMKRLINSNILIREILLEGFFIWGVHVSNKESQGYQVANEVTQFPHVAIWEPRTECLVWRCDGWDSIGDPLLVERFAEALLSHGSYDPYEGLDSALQTSPILGDAKPPTHLVFAGGGFRALLDEAWASRKWVLVNLQNDSTVASHVLNRDVWHDAAVGEIIRENFVFWQKVCIRGYFSLILFCSSPNVTFCKLRQMNATIEGSVYAEIFQVKNYPHVAILNPFTGRVQWRKEGWVPGSTDELTADTFAQAVVNLPDLESLSATRPGLSRQPSEASSQGERSWELLSLLDTWERVSVGTLEDPDDEESHVSVSSFPVEAEDSKLPGL